MGNGNEQFIQKAQDFLGTAKGSKFDKSAIIYNFIRESDEPEAAWEYFFENADKIDSSDEKEVTAFFTAQQLQKYEKEYSNLIEALLDKLIMSHCEKEKFYSELWESIMGSDILCRDDSEKIYAIARIWSDPRIPYFYVKDGIKMSDEEFTNIIEKNRLLLQEISFVLNCKYEQRTEVGSILLDVIENCSNEKEKAVIMAIILELTEKKLLYSIMKNQ